MDLENGLDHVLRGVLWGILREYGVFGPLIRAVSSLYDLCHILDCVERSQMRWFGYLVKMPPGRLHGKAFRARPSGWRSLGRTRTRWRDYASPLAWEHFGTPVWGLDEVLAGEREVWLPFLGCCPCDPTPGKRKKSQIS